MVHSNIRAILTTIFLVATPALGQPVSKLPRVAFLGLDSHFQAPFVASFVERMRIHGYEDGRNIIFDYRWAERRFERLPALVGELLALKPDVIVTAAPPAVRAVQQATTTIPTIVLVHDPVGGGFVQTLARPGRNITGVAFQDPELATKRLDLLRQMVPNLNRVGAIWNKEGGVTALSTLEQVARQMGIELLVVEVVRPAELPDAVAKLKAGGVQGVLQLASPLITYHRAALIEAAARHRMPMLCEMRAYVVDGCLATYSASLPAMFATMADYVHRVLRGAPVETLPVDQPREFEFVVNEKTATALGLRIPPLVQYQATELIR